MQNQYLYHYGIKGMRWGVRRYQNADGSLTDAGKKRLARTAIKTYQKSLDKHDYDAEDVGKIEEVAKMYSSEKIQKARQNLMDADKLSEEFFDDDALVEEYQLKAARKAWEQYGDGTPENLEDFEWGYLYGDADQGNDNSFILFLQDRKIDPQQYSHNLAVAKKEYRNACEEATEELLGKYKNASLSAVPKSTALDAIVSGLEGKVNVEMHKRNMWGWLYT